MTTDNRDSNRILGQLADTIARSTDKLVDTLKPVKKSVIVTIDHNEYQIELAEARKSGRAEGLVHCCKLLAEYLVDTRYTSGVNKDIIRGKFMNNHDYLYIFLALDNPEALLKRLQE